MPFHLHLSTVEVLWTLTFAALLVLLVVLLGRDRDRRYPFFTFSIVVVALRLLVSRLLYNRISPVAMSTIFYSLSLLTALASLLVVVELARRAFAGASRRTWSVATLVVLGIAVGTLALWGPWPAWKTFVSGGLLALLRAVELIGERGDMLAGMLAIELCILIALFGRRFNAPWRSHTQQLILGLSTAAIAELAVRGTWQLIALKTSVHSQADYDRVMSLQEKLYNANNVIYICVIVWWIVCMWIDEPGTPAAAPVDHSPEDIVPVALLDEGAGK
jgi:hypothetical protein